MAALRRSASFKALKTPAYTPYQRCLVAYMPPSTRLGAGGGLTRPPRYYEEARVAVPGPLERRNGARVNNYPPRVTTAHKCK